MGLHHLIFKTAPFESGAIKNQKGLPFAERVNFCFTGSSKQVDKFLKKCINLCSTCPKV